jgi:hypothetical protein
MARKYFTLVERNEDGKWYPQFGDWKREVVAQEIIDRRAGFEAPRAKDLKIIASGPRQVEINAAIAKFNAFTAFAQSMQSVRKAEGHAPYGVRALAQCWAELSPAEQAEWATPKIEPALTPAELVAAVKAHATANYESGGWDIIVECWSDAEIEEAIAGATSIKQAIAKVERTASLLGEQRAEIKSTEW